MVKVKNYTIPTALLLLVVIIHSPLFATFGTIKGKVKKKGSNITLAKVKITIVSVKNPRLRYVLYTDKKGSFYKRF